MLLAAVCCCGCASRKVVQDVRHVETESIEINREERTVKLACKADMHVALSIDSAVVNIPVFNDGDSVRKIKIYGLKRGKRIKW